MTQELTEQLTQTFDVVVIRGGAAGVIARAS
jgi:hypothetical protein